MAWLSEGQRVKGVYMNNIPFIGTIKEARFITVRSDTRGYIVDLEEPVEVFGTKHASLMIHAGFDGQGTDYVDCNERIEAI